MNLLKIPKRKFKNCRKFP